MCDYCGCQQRSTVVELTADRAGAIGLCGELVTLLAPHTDREEGGLFEELAAVGLDGHTERLVADHEALDVAFQAVLDGDGSTSAALPAALRRLEQHIWSEEYDVFPTALQVLSDAAWTRLDAEGAVPTAGDHRG